MLMISLHVLGRKMYVNLLTGNTCYEMPESLEKEALEESENMVSMVIGEYDIATYA